MNRIDEYRNRLDAVAHPLAAQAVALRHEMAPGMDRVCMTCRQTFDGGSIRCPHCGWIMTESEAAGIITDIQRNIANLAAARTPLHIDAPAEAEEVVRKQDAPPSLDDVIGNASAVLQIRTALAGHKYAARRARGLLPFSHILLCGPGGTGKTMLSEIVARELNREIHLQLGQTLNSPTKVGEALLALRPGDVLFVDEIHGMKPACQEALYRAMEDGILVPITRAGKGPGEPVQLPPFTLIGATTDEWELLPSLCQRFKHIIRLRRMTTEEIGEALLERAQRAGWTVSTEAVTMMASRSLGTPRLAVRLMDGCMTTANADGGDEITADVVRKTCEIWGIDRLGLDAVARQYLSILAQAGSTPVRLNVIASKLDGLARSTVERKIEPDLVWLGLVEKDNNGRRLTDAGRKYMGALS